MIVLENSRLKAGIHPLGAELKSVVHKDTGTEMMWQANPAVWARTSPVLFPVVGKVKDGQLLVNGQAYAMGQHGFARDMEFAIHTQTTEEAVFKLNSNTQTKAIYPYDFELYIGYRLTENSITCHWQAVNTGTQTMYFAIGAHPGFNLPTGRMQDYELEFEQPETAGRHLLQDGLIGEETTPLLNNQNRLPLHSSLFDADAIVLKNLRSNALTLKQKNGTYAIKVSWLHFPYLGIWSKKGWEAFLCIEPWCGHADGPEGHTDISQKAGINSLKPAQVFERAYTMAFLI